MHHKIKLFPVATKGNLICNEHFRKILYLCGYKTTTMITVISGTNRKGSECLRFAQAYQTILKEVTAEEVKLLALEDIPHDWYFPEMYQKGNQAPSLVKLQDEFILPAEKLVYVISEYNGGFPGAVKIFLDACSVRELKPSFKGKKAALVGVATGRAGNLRGMDHLTGVLHHLGTIVLPNKLPISKIKSLMDAEGNIVDEGTLEVMKKQAIELIGF